MQAVNAARDVLERERGRERARKRMRRQEGDEIEGRGEGEEEEEEYLREALHTVIDERKTQVLFSCAHYALPGTDYAYDAMPVL